jgi:sugar lactone lactonase YvrE
VRAELVSDAQARLGEGPIWDARTSELLWVDISSGVVHRFDPLTGSDRPFDGGTYVSAIVPRAAGGYALAVAAGFAVATEDGRVMPLTACGHDEAVRMNDGACDSSGRFWAGSMRIDESDFGGCLYRLDADHSLTTICDGVSISNGIAWSLDDTVMYYVDTPRQAVDAWDFDAATGTAGNRRQLFAVEEPGYPDGLIVDSEGFLWIALWGGGCVRRYSPDGELADEVGVAAANATKPAFGGPSLTDLYITSAAGEGEHPGGLFVVQPGVTGLPVHAYAG